MFWKSKWKSILLFFAKVALLSLFLLCTYTFITPLVFIPFISEPLFWGLFTVLVAVAACFSPLRPQFLTGRIAVWLLNVCILGVVSLCCYKAVDALYTQSWYWSRDWQYKQVQKFIDRAEDAVWYSSDSHLDDSLKEAFPELLRPEEWSDGTHYAVTDTALLDYDTMTAGFFYYDVAKFSFETFKLSSAVPVPESYDVSCGVTLGAPGARMDCYFQSRGPGNGYNIICISVTMADGTVYACTDLTDPTTGRNYYLGLPTHAEGFERINDFKERKEYD